MSRRDLDVQLIRRAAAGIAEITMELDRTVDDEPSEAARMRRLREATNQIVRLANDAIQAYRRATNGARADAAAGRGDVAEHERIQVEIKDARAELISELERASRRYPWADPWRAAPPAPKSPRPPGD